MGNCGTLAPHPASGGASATFPRGGRQACLLLLLQNLLRDLAAAHAGVHGALFDQAVGVGLGVAFFLNQIALCAVHQPQLGDFVQQLCVLGPQHSQALVAAGRDLHGLPELCAGERLGQHKHAEILQFIRDLLRGAGLGQKDDACVGLFHGVGAQFVAELIGQGRVDDDDLEAEKNVELASDDFTAIAAKILEGCGGKENIASIDNCVTRLRLEVKDMTAVNDKVIKSAGVAGVIRPGKTSVQVIVGTKVQFVADAFSKLCE